jgi:hypothetical protein
MSENEKNLTKKIEMLMQRIERLEFLCDADVVTILEFSEEFFKKTVKIRCQKQDWDVISYLSEYLKEDMFAYSFEDALDAKLIKNIGCVEKDQSDLITAIRKLRSYSRNVRDLRDHTEKDNKIFMEDIFICQAIER